MACIAAGTALASCSISGNAGNAEAIDGNRLEALIDTLEDITGRQPAQIGVAVIFDNRDTIVVNNRTDYPLMSMFKLHEALAVCHVLDNNGISLDTVFDIDRAGLNPDTWSPMLKDHISGCFKLTAGELIDYILIHSDNNASNLLFDRVVTVNRTDSIIRSTGLSDDFLLRYKEAEMQADHQLSYSNRTSPLAYAKLVNRVFTDSILSPSKQEFIKRAMTDCNTGLARLAAPLAGQKGVKFAHRTGSGYINERGEIVAVNDGGYVTLPSGKGYSIAVFVKDYAGEQESAEKAIAEISSAVFSHIKSLN